MGGQIIFYWDVFLILNFIMNLFLLGMTGFLRRKYFVKKRLFLAALSGSILMTAAVSVLLWLDDGGGLDGRIRLLSVPLAAVTGWGMLQTAFQEKQNAEKRRNFQGLIQVSVLTGGSIFLFREWLDGFFCAEMGVWLILAGAMGIFFVFLLGMRRAGSRELQSHTMDGVLTASNGKTCSLRVLFDSGNGLVSPYSGEAVMILDKGVAEQMGVGKEQNPLWIPFHSIGGDGMLPAYRFPCLELQNGQKKENFLAAVSDNISADGAVQMILNKK